MIQKKSAVVLLDVVLSYVLHFERTNSLKEWMINLLTRRSYTSEKKRYVHALDSVNLNVSEGERVGIIGLNGSGKSTLLKVISGILKPTNGMVSVIGDVQPLIEIGAGFDPEFTGRENIYLNGYMLGFTRSQIREKEKEIVDFADIGDFIDTPIKYYSSGMSVRLAFTIATMIRPDILVFDEMLAAGDAAFMHKAQRRIDELITEARIIVLVSHDLGLVNKVCTRVLVMNSGKIVFDGVPGEALKFYQKIVDGKD